MCLGSMPFSGHSAASKQAHRADVGVQIHFEAHAQQDFFGVNVRGDTRIAKGTYQNRIEIAFQHGEATGRDRT